jgi:membrane-bound lytic murein transglycosylase D
MMRHVCRYLPLFWIAAAAFCQQRIPAPIADSLPVRNAEKMFQEARIAASAGNASEARALLDRALNELLEIPPDDPQREVYDRYIQNFAEQVYALDLESLGAARGVEDVRFDKSPLDEIRELTFPVDPGLKTKVQKEVQQTTSQLPLVVNDTVLSFINYFANGRGRKTLEYALKRSGKYRPMIFRILAEEGVPAELIYLAQAESGFLPRAVSYKAAVGMWQFIKDTGRVYGLQQTAFTDDRLDPERATRAAARHLRDLYEELGDWHLALAAYNCGTGCVDRAVQRTAYADYWELRNRKAVPIETTNYVPIILALTIIMKNPAEYGLANLELEAPLEYDTIEVYSNTSLQLAADAAGVPLPQLQDLNPAVLHNMVPTGYFLRVPKGTGPTVASAFDLVPKDKRDTWRLHRVQSGDTAETIGAQFHVPAKLIEDANPNLAGAQFAAVPQMMVRPKPTPTKRSRYTASKRTPTRVTRTTTKPTPIKRGTTKPTTTKPTAIRKAPIKPTAKKR